MDVLTLSRIQFAVATYFHFLFVPLTLGLSVLVAIMETKYVRSGDEDYKRHLGGIPHPVVTLKLRQG